MDNDLIDDQLLSPSGQKGNTWGNASGLIFLWVGIALSIVFGHYGDPKLWGAIGIVAIGTYCIYIQQRAMGLGVLIFGLLLGLFGLLFFSPFSFDIILGIIRVDIVLVAMMIILVSTNPDIMQQLTGQREVMSEEERQLILDQKSRTYQGRFRKMSTTELEKIVTDRTLVPAAVRAAEIILAERADN